MEKFKNPLQKCSRCTECEAPVISIQTEQKASCGFISPAPRPLPLPRPPWQRENIWEGAPEQSIKPGGRPITRPRQSGPARSTPPGFVSLLTATYSLCAPEALTQPPTCTWFHFASYSPAISCPPPSGHLLLPQDAPLFPGSPSRLPSLRSRREQRRAGAGAGAQQETILLIWLPCSTRVSFWRVSRARCPGATACLKRCFTASCFPCSSFPERQPIKTPNKY